MFSKNIRYTITGDMFKSIYTPIPPKNEQIIIGEKLDNECKKIDALMANEEKQIEKLKEYKQSLITEVVTKGLDPDVPMKDSGVDWIGEIPMQWDISRVRFIGRLQNGISKGGDSFGSGYPFVSYGDVYKNYEIPKDELQVIPKVYTDDGMGYGAMGWFVTDIDYCDNNICNIWIDKSDDNVGIYLMDKTYPGMIITNPEGKHYIIETYLKDTERYRIRRMNNDTPEKSNNNELAEFVDRQEIIKWVNNGLSKI
jgi:restriction endonuclease S subunit